MKRVNTIWLIVLAVLVGNTFAGTYSGGSGTEGNPYRIGSADDILEMSNEPNDWDDHGKKVLQRFVGNWEFEITSSTTKEIHYKGKGQYTSELNDYFVRNQAWMKESSQNEKLEFMSILTYDQKANVFRRWIFQADGSFPRSEETGTWDQSAQMMTWTAIIDNGVIRKNTERFINNDTEVISTLVMIDEKGAILLDMKGKSKRLTSNNT